MTRKDYQISVEQLEKYVLRFGPMTSSQITKHFGASYQTGVSKKLSGSIKVKSVPQSSRRGLVWYHINGIKPEGITE